MRQFFPVEDLARDERFVQTNMAERMKDARTELDVKESSAKSRGASKRLTPDRFTAMVRLDQNRAQAQLAKKAGVDLTAVKDIFIYGNHSPTMFPAFAHATINGKPATEVINDSAWLQGPFLETVGKRGAAIIAARGLSSAASAANALVDHVRSLMTPGAIHSVAVKGATAYGFDANVWAGVPVRTTTPDGRARPTTKNHHNPAPNNARTRRQGLNPPPLDIHKLGPIQLTHTRPPSSTPACTQTHKAAPPPRLRSPPRTSRAAVQSR